MKLYILHTVSYFLSSNLSSVYYIAVVVFLVVFASFFLGATITPILWPFEIHGAFLERYSEYFQMSVQLPFRGIFHVGK